MLSSSVFLFLRSTGAREGLREEGRKKEREREKARKEVSQGVDHIKE